MDYKRQLPPGGSVEGEALPDRGPLAGASDAFIPDGGPGILRNGFMRLESSHDPFPFYGPWAGEDENGNTFEGDPRSRGGFLTRPQGEER